jgi:hypothetical protein
VYRPESDTVVAWHSLSYGRLDWPLPNQARPASDPTTRAAVFAAALLEGKVRALGRWRAGVARSRLDSCRGAAAAAAAAAGGDARPAPLLAPLQVLPSLGRLKGSLVAQPATAARPEMRVLPRVGELVGGAACSAGPPAPAAQLTSRRPPPWRLTAAGEKALRCAQVRALAQQRVGSRRELALAWAAKPAFLQPELAMWLPRGRHAQLAQLWPELQREAAAAGAAGAAAAAGGKAGGGKAGGGKEAARKEAAARKRG